MNCKAVVFSLFIWLSVMGLAFGSANDISAADVPAKLVLPKGTIIKVQAVDTISSQTARLRAKFPFRVTEDIKWGDVTFITANTDVEATITKVKKAGPWDRDGEIEISFSEVQMKDSYSLPVTGALCLKGDKPNVLVRYSLLGVLVRGKEAVIKAGTEVKLQTQEEVKASGYNNSNDS